jgi:hypothetical protein
LIAAFGGVKFQQLVDVLNVFVERGYCHTWHAPSGSWESVYVT